MKYYVVASLSYGNLVLRVKNKKEVIEYLNDNDIAYCGEIKTLKDFSDSILGMAGNSPAGLSGHLLRLGCSRHGNRSFRQQDQLRQAPDNRHHHAPPGTERLRQPLRHPFHPWHQPGGHGAELLHHRGFRGNLRADAGICEEADLPAAGAGLRLPLLRPGGPADFLHARKGNPLRGHRQGQRLCQ